MPLSVHVSVITWKGGKMFAMLNFVGFGLSVPVVDLSVNLSVSIICLSACLYFYLSASGEPGPNQIGSLAAVE